jgi:hypothetical protein
MKADEEWLEYAINGNILSLAAELRVNHFMCGRRGARG